MVAVVSNVTWSSWSPAPELSPARSAPQLRLVPPPAVLPEVAVQPEKFAGVSAHVILAGAIEGAAALGSSMGAPWLAPILEVGSGALVACVAADAARRVVAREIESLRVDGVATRKVLAASVKSMNATSRCTIAGRALEFAVRRRTIRTIQRATGAVVTSCANAAIGSVVSGVLFATAPQVLAATRVLSISRATWRGATFVQTVETEAASHVRAHAATSSSR